MSVVFTDNFTVGADVNINAYPATPDYAMTVGAAADIKVIAATDRAESQVVTNCVARIINAAAPTGDQQITANIGGGGAASVGLAVRCATDGTGNCYVAFFVSTSSSIELYRVDTGTFSLLTTFTGRAFGDPFVGRFKATGAGATVTLEIQADSTAIATFDDTNALRKTSGTSGIMNGNTSTWHDNISVDDLLAAAAATLMGQICM